MMVSFVFVMIMIAEASSDRIREVLEEVPEMEDAPDALTEVANGDIDFEHVDFSYRRRRRQPVSQRRQPSY